MERHVLCRIHHPCNRGMRFLLWSFWTHGAARPDNHPNGAQARLLFPVALCATFTSSSIARDAVPSDRSTSSHSWLDSPAISFGRRGKKLEAAADCGGYRADDLDHARHVYSSRS